MKCLFVPSCDETHLNDVVECWRLDRGSRDRRDEATALAVKNPRLFMFHLWEDFIIALFKNRLSLKHSNVLGRTMLRHTSPRRNSLRHTLNTLDALVNPHVDLVLSLLQAFALFHHEENETQQLKNHTENLSEFLSLIEARTEDMLTVFSLLSGMSFFAEGTCPRPGAPRISSSSARSWNMPGVNELNSYRRVHLSVRFSSMRIPL